MDPQLTFTVESTDPTSNLNLQVKLNQETVFNGIVTDPVLIAIIPDTDEGASKLTIELSGKTAADTQIDSNGNIIKDAVLKCSNFTIDDINIDSLMTELSTYTHDFNGTAEETVSKFYGIMGCNGTVHLQFTTPIYLWLLENT